MDSATGIPGVEEAKHFFKSSWPEDSRPKENDVIEEAKSRVRQYLPKPQQEVRLRPPTSKFLSQDW
jgi:hypothetical protein